MLGTGRGGRGLKTKARTEREAGVAGREEVREDMLDKPTSGSAMDADPTRSRSKNQLDSGETPGVGEWEREEAKAPVKRMRSPIRPLGPIRRRNVGVVVEGKDGKAPEKPEIVAGKKRRIEQAKTKGRSTFSAITSSEEGGTESEDEGSAKKKQRLASVMVVSDEDDEETEDELGMCSAL